MTKQIKKLEDGSIQFKNGRIEMPKNEVFKIDDDTVYFFLNKRKYLARMNTEDYLKNSLWATLMTYDHLGPHGVVAYHNGWEHKSVAAVVMSTSKGQKVGYADTNRFNLCRENLVVRGAAFA